MRLLVLGLGPAGSAAAITGRQRGADVHMLGQWKRRGLRPGETLPPHASPLLRELQVYEQVLQSHVISPGIVSTWANETVSELDFVFDAFGYGWHLDRRLFDEQLLTVAANLGAQVNEHAKLCAADRQQNAWAIEFEDARGRQTIIADLVIDATGRAAWLGKQMSIQRERVDSLVGLVACMNGRLTNDGRTHLEAAEYGWWYFADLPGDQCIAAFMTDNTIAAAFPGGARVMWRRMLGISPLAVACQAKAVNAFQVVAASSARMSQFAGIQWAAVGDAAMTWDPLSSQGITNALDSGRRAAMALIDGPHALNDYCKWMEDGWDQYLQMRTYFYGCVNRWPHSNFWKRRSSSPIIVEATPNFA